MNLVADQITIIIFIVILILMLLLLFITITKYRKYKKYYNILLVMLILALMALLIINIMTTSNERFTNPIQNCNYGFSNCILLIVFNYADCVKNKDFYKSLYGKYFKTIIFYSDTGSSSDNKLDPEVNYLSINRGYFTHRIFSHFATKYADLLESTSGVFYTMDDNIINLNILNLYRNDKIMYYHNEVKQLEEYSGWWWDNDLGKSHINNLMQDTEFQTKYNWAQFSGTFADWFYLPKRYWTETLTNAFDLMAKHEVFLELAIPSVINNIAPDKNDYQHFTENVLWGDDRKKLLDRQYIYDCINKHHNLILHPIKFNENPAAKDWLTTIFGKTKCVIITTIHNPSETVLKHIKNPEYDVIIVGDNKTPSDEYLKLDCIYLDIAAQKTLFPSLTDLIPYNHYCRKNLGYLYAIKKGYTVIYETDDDNIPHDNFDSILAQVATQQLQMLSQTNDKWLNIFKYFTGNADIWPRGYPHSIKDKLPVFSSSSVSTKKPVILNGLVDNEPDVDAVYRLSQNKNNVINWDSDKTVVIDNKNMCPFNTQNTFWINNTETDITTSMLIPCSVSFRYCDILRGIIAGIVLKQTDNYMLFTSPNVTQIRNEHNLEQDLASEQEMYKHNENILDFIENGLSSNSNYNIKDLLVQIYNNLLTNGVIKQLDIDILAKWLEYF